MRTRKPLQCSRTSLFCSTQTKHQLGKVKTSSCSDITSSWMFPQWLWLMEDYLISRGICTALQNFQDACGRGNVGKGEVCTQKVCLGSHFLTEDRCPCLEPNPYLRILWPLLAGWEAPKVDTPLSLGG
jgi:hypothetical protein